MLILGIETSCDETGAAVVEDGSRVLSNVLFSQDEIHAPFGGVVPELACRRHVLVIANVVEKALDGANIRPTDLDGIAVTRGPGLMGALLVGISFAKALAYRHRRPLIGINHLEGHMAAVRLEGEASGRIEFPVVALVVSGGHTNLYRMNSFQDCRQIGRTIDDAAGEAFDKGAKMLGLGFPGGPAIDRLAREGDPKAVPFPRPYTDKDIPDFSFSGLKTSLRYYLNRNPDPSPGHRADVAASYQEAIVDVLAVKSLRAVEATGAKGLVVSGGVAANSRLRTVLESSIREVGARLIIPRPAYCTDNGAMIAAAAHGRVFLDPARDAGSFLSMSADPRWPAGVSA